ncbi:MAG: hypothetical protein B7Z35_00420 [Hydrogenophilales bacterium 12-61-10]|nr:MAG: hypothetical protein B7Z35_00420 [Hydrogenophilales bacterium 12-61-10]OYX29677.1 MAG: hypothetical protein B7Z03_08185 [Hydrogenophilales bacterium 32-62-9]
MITTDCPIAPAASSFRNSQIDRALKTAERQLLVRKGKPVFASAIASAAPAGVSDDVRQALRSLSRA